jgi:hypothetical protein
MSLLLRRTRQLFDPREIEGVVLAAGDKLDAAITGLVGGEVAVGVRRDAVGVGEAFLAADDEAAVAPLLSLSTEGMDSSGWNISPLTKTVCNTSVPVPSEPPADTPDPP